MARIWLAGDAGAAHVKRQHRQALSHGFGGLCGGGDGHISAVIRQMCRVAYEEKAQLAAQGLPKPGGKLGANACRLTAGERNGLSIQ